MLRQIPSVEEVLNRPAIREMGEQVGRKFVTDRVREVIAALRREVRTNSGQTVPRRGRAHIEALVARLSQSDLCYSLRPVINATGVILHTNLGRAPLAREALDHSVEVASQYSNLEYDLASGRRGNGMRTFRGLWRSCWARTPPSRSTTTLRLSL